MIAELLDFVTVSEETEQEWGFAVEPRVVRYPRRADSERSATTVISPLRVATAVGIALLAPAPIVATSAGLDYSYPRGVIVGALPGSHVVDLSEDGARRYDPLMELRQHIRSFADLPYGWDSYDGEPLPIAVVDEAISLLTATIEAGGPTPKAYPTGRESVQFDYRTPDGRYLEVEVFESEVGYLFVDAKGKATERDDVEQQEVVNVILSMGGHGR